MCLPSGKEAGVHFYSVKINCGCLPLPELYSTFLEVTGEENREEEDTWCGDQVWDGVDREFANTVEFQLTLLLLNGKLYDCPVLKQ